MLDSSNGRPGTNYISEPRVACGPLESSDRQVAGRDFGYGHRKSKHILQPTYTKKILIL